MIDVPTNSVKLVEYNTIASSFGILSQKVLVIQDYIRHKYGENNCNVAELKYNYEELVADKYANDPELQKIIKFVQTS